MTLTRIMPTLRRSLPDPINPALWPEATTVTTTDVVVSGVSLRGLIEAAGTPCVHGAADRAILVARITGIAPDVTGALIIQTDADLTGLPLVWSETRLISRASTARSAIVVLARHPSANDSDEDDDVFAGELPSDLRIGDVLAIPSHPLVDSARFAKTTAIG